jgi:HPt (histidine-containing phosphotransfer) domain-containing protein
VADKEQEFMNSKFVVIVDEELRDLIPGYLENRRKDITAIAGALDRGDFEAISSLCHKIKGSGGGYGFDEISEIGRACEDAAKRSQAQEIRDQVNRLQDYLDNVELVFQP